MAFGTVGILEVLLKTNNSQLTSGLSDAEKASQKTQQNMQSSWAQTAQKMGTVGMGMTAAITAPLVAGGIAAVKLASDMTETMGKVEVTFGENAAAVEKWADTSIEKMGLAGQSAMDAAALFGDMGAGMGLAAQTNYEMATSLVQLSADMASFKNISQERAKIALQSVYTGETETLKSLGVVMTQANLQQFAMSQGITKNIQQMTQQEQVMLRYNYVMSVTANSQGDFARTSDNMANQARMAGEQVKQAGVMLGQTLLPMATKALKGINDLLKGFNNMSAGQQKMVVGLAGIAAAAGPVLSIVSKGITTFKTLQSAFTGVSTATKAVTTATTATSAAMTATNASSTAAAAGLTATGTAGAASAASLTAAGAGGGVAAAGMAATGAAATAATPPVATLGMTLNMAIPIVGLIAVGITALVMAFQHLGSESAAAAEAIKTDTEKIKAGVDEVIDAQADSQVSYIETVGTIQVEAEQARVLASELENLRNGTDNSAGAQARMRNVTQELAGKYPELSSLIDENTGILNANADQINKIIDASERMAELHAQIERTAELEQELTDVTVELYTVQTQLATAEEGIITNEGSIVDNRERMNQLVREGLTATKEGAAEYERLRNEMSTSAAEVGAYGSQISNLTGEEKTLASAIEETRKKIEASKTATKIGAQAMITEFLPTLSAASQGYISLQTASNNYTDADIANIQMLLENGAELDAGQTEVFGNIIKLHNAAKVADEDYVSAIQDGRVAIDEAEAASLEQRRLDGEEFTEIEQAKIDRWAEMQIQAIEDGQVRLTAAQAAELESKIASNQTLTEIEQAKLDKYREIQQGYVDAASETSRLLAENQNQSLEAQAINAEANTELVAQFIKDQDFLRSQLPGMSKYVDQLTEADAVSLRTNIEKWDNGGKEQVERYFNSQVAAANVGAPNVEGAIRASGEGAVKADGEVMSPEAGEGNSLAYMGGKIAGVETAAPELTAATTGAANDAMEGARGVSLSPEWAAIGGNMVSGMAQGVRNATGILTSAIVSVVNSGIQAAKDAAVIESPSKLFRDQVGFQFGAGMAAGVVKSTPLVTQALDSQIKKLADAGDMLGFAQNPALMYNPVVNLPAASGGSGRNSPISVSITVYPKSLNPGEVDNLVYKVNKEVRRLANI